MLLRVAGESIKKKKQTQNLPESASDILSKIQIIGTPTFKCPSVAVQMGFKCLGSDYSQRCRIMISENFKEL